MQDLTVAAYQMTIQTGKTTSNISKVESLLGKHQKEELDFLALPELFTTGFDYTNFANLAEQSENSSTLSKLISLSQEYNIGFGGSILVVENKNQYYNLGFIISPSKGLEYTYKKIHLWGTEKEYFQNGSQIPEPVVFENKVKIGLAICYDLRFPEIYRSLANNGAELLITVASWPQQRWKHFKLLSQARALENTCYHIAVNRIGIEHSPATVKYNGSSGIYTPMGETMIFAEKKEDLIIGRLEADSLEKTRGYIPVLKDKKLL